MAKIRQFNIFRYNKVSKMLFAIAPDEKISFFSSLAGLPADLIQNFLSLRFKKSPESYIAVNDEGEVKAFITIEKTLGNIKKWFIKSLFLTKNSFDEGAQLIDFVISKYGAHGADTFCVLIDENDDTSAGIFSKMCGFRLCSREVIWLINNLDTSDAFSKDNFNKFKNSDAKEVANLYNDNIDAHFRYSLENEPQEFTADKSSLKFVLKTEKGQIYAFCRAKNINRKDYLADIIVSKGYEHSFEQILKGFYSLLSEKAENIFFLNRNYTSSAKNVEHFLSENGLEKIQTKMLLVKDFYKPIKDSESIVNPAVIFKEISGKPAFFSSKSLQK
ncbi:MAG: hypothetical protein K6C94_04510 [Candidatus Gastranaerophilales bacterium]|nr:hypothetical protein [Candidatus Gastranaerophilales bacterium]